MEALTISLSTFLKIAASRPRGKIGTIRTFTTVGGYDFYKVMKNIAKGLAKKEISLADAMPAIAKIKQAPERKHTLELIQQFHAWHLKAGLKWKEPKKVMYISPSKLLKVRLTPDLSFENAVGGTTSFSLWNMTKPTLTCGLAAEGIQFLVNELKPAPHDEIGILHVRQQLVFDKSLLTAASSAHLKLDLMVVEEIWKDIHDPKMGVDETVAHIASIGIPPP